MADITVDSAVQDNFNALTSPRTLVWINKTTGYMFFIDSAIDFHYRKTTDSGASWGTEVTIRTGTVLGFSIWYDRWTKGDSGDIIHMAFVDTNDDNITYNSFDTNDDTLDGEVTVLNGSTADGGASFVFRCISIVKAKGGNVYVGGWIDNDGENGFFRATQSPATSFTSRTTMADGNVVDRIQFLTGSETDTNDIWSIYQDASANQITLKVYDDTGNSWSESSSIDSIAEATVFFGYDAMDRHSDGHAILVMWNANQSTTADLAVWDITDISTQTAKTDVIVDDSVHGICGLVINQQNDNLYAIYSDGATIGQIFYQISTDGGGTWDGAVALSITADDHKGIFSGSIIGNDGGRMMPQWFNDDLNSLVTNKDNSVEINEVELFDAAILGCNF